MAAPLLNLPDLNLLVTLDVLLAEGSVAVAARRLRLSPSAMSRQLARLREATGDPLLVRAGRGLVPTPRAAELKALTSPLVAQAQSLLRPAVVLDIKTLKRSFTLRASDGFVENFGPALIAAAKKQAPGVRLQFIPKIAKDSAPLRDGTVDLETGVVGAAQGPELRIQALFRDRLVGVVRRGHALTKGKVTPTRYAAQSHIFVSRRVLERGPIDDILEEIGVTRDIATIVGGFSAAIALARHTDLVATVPERYTATLAKGLIRFPLPFKAPEITISMLWHPRQDADPAHRWLRGVVREVCGAK